jgi:hypothetical protein
MIYADGSFDTPLWENKDNVITCYMAKSDFDYELGGNMGGNVLYPSIESCYGNDIVEVEVRLKRVVKKTESNTQEYKENFAEFLEYQRLRNKYDPRRRHFLELQEKEKNAETNQSN